MECGRWEWSGGNILIVTGNDPISGKHYHHKDRHEVGYAGYIGIEGGKDKVAKVAKLIREHGEYDGESPGRRDFI